MPRSFGDTTTLIKKSSAKKGHSTSINFGERISELRRLENMNQRELAAKIGVSQAAISFWERGERTPDIYELAALADCFQVSADYLIGREK